MDDAGLGELIDHRNYFRQRLAGSCFVGARFQVANGITGGLSAITILFPAFSTLTHVFLCCLMISHVFFEFGRQR